MVTVAMVLPTELWSLLLVFRPRVLENEAPAELGSVVIVGGTGGWFEDGGGCIECPSASESTAAIVRVAGFFLATP